MALNDKFYFGFVRILYVKVAGEFVPVACLLSHDFEETSEQLATTTRENENGWATSVPTKQSYSISFEGLQINTIFGGNNQDKASYDRLKALKRGRTIFDWELRTLDGLFVDYGKGYISDLGETAGMDDFLSFTGTIVGVGEPAFTSNFLENVTWDNNILDWSNTLVTFDNDGT